MISLGHDVTKPIKSKTKMYYLPHHPVLTPEKEAIKICVVFDTSVKTKDTASSLRFVQQKCFMEVFTALDNKKHSLINQLGLKNDNHNILRCYG